MFRDALQYPTRGPWLRRTVVGGLLTLGTAFLFPVIVLVGYVVTVLERSAAGEDTPPAFDDWYRLGSRGLGGLIIIAAYGLGPVIVAALVGLTLTELGVVLLQEFAPLLSREETLIWGVGVLAGLVAGVVGLCLFSIILACWYVLPAALGRYGTTGSVGAGFELRELRPIITSSEYLLAIAITQLVPLMVVAAAFVLAITIVGLLVVPALPFLGTLCCARLVGVAIAD